MLKVLVPPMLETLAKALLTRWRFDVGVQFYVRFVITLEYVKLLS